MAKKEAARSIVLNVMYNGKYLNENMGHEVINLFKDDKDRNFLYLNPYGNFSSENRKVEKMLMVIPVPRKNMFEVVALATGLTEVFKPVKNYNPMLDRNKETEANRIAYEEVRRTQLEYIRGNKITYGGVPLDQLFGDDQQQAVYITYQAEQVLKPKKRIFISFQEGHDTETDESVYLSLSTYKQAKMPQKQYITLQSDTDNKLDWYLLNDRVLENAERWEEYPSVTIKSAILGYKPKEDSLFDICGIADSELAFSNALAHYIKKYTYLFKDVFGITSETVSVEREHEYIDILIKDGEKRIIVENKIHSAINRKKSDKAGESQLNRYWEQLTEKEGIAESDVTAFILCPEYVMEQMKEDVKRYKNHEKYTIISYKTLWHELKDAGDTEGDVQFGIFVDALKKHKYHSVPESRYEEMKSLFFKRIIDVTIAGMNL